MVENQKFKSDCGDGGPINVGDVFGGFKVTGIRSTKGGPFPQGSNGSCIDVEYRYTVTDNSGGGADRAVSVRRQVDAEADRRPVRRAARTSARTFTRSSACVPPGTKNTATVQTVPCDHGGGRRILCRGYGEGAAGPVCAGVPGQQIQREPAQRTELADGLQ